MPSLDALLVALTYPPTLSLSLLACAVLAALSRWPRMGLALGGAALAWSLLWSVPRLSDLLRHPLEHRYPRVAEASLPRADAIVVLGGGGNYTWLERGQVDPFELRSSRLAAGARAWLAGRAPVVILSGRRGEIREMAAASTRLGIPQSAVLLEPESRDTRDNAVFTARLADRLRLRRVLLVTSAVHMPRASLLFRRAGLVVVPVPVPERAPRLTWAERWLPTRSALWRSGRALKEYAGLVAVHLQPLRCDEPPRVNAASSRGGQHAPPFSRG